MTFSLAELVAGLPCGLKNLENLNLEKSQYPWGNLGKFWILVIFNNNPGKMLRNMGKGQELDFLHPVWTLKQCSTL